MKGKRLQKSSILLIIPIVYIILLFVWFFLNDYPTNFTIQEEYLLTCNEETQIRVFTFIPNSYGYQKISNIRISPNINYTIEDNNQLSILRINDTLPIGKTTIVINYDVNLKRGKVEWGENEVNPYITYLNNIDNELKNISKEITKSAGTEDAIAIHNYVAKYMKWDYSEKINKEPKSAIELYKEPKGVCGDFATLMVGLSHSKGIPAKKITGLALPRFFNKGKAKEWGHQAGAHGWVEVFVDNNWHFSDPSWGTKYFNYSDGLHLSFGESRAFEEIYESQMLWLKEDFHINAAMSMPLMFGIASSDSNLNIVPKGNVIIDYFSYYLYLLPLLGYVLIIAITLYIRWRTRVKKKASDQSII